MDDPRIAVVGSANMDLVTYTPRIPAAGETRFGDRFEMGFGGKGANQAVMAALLGGRVRMVGCVGEDAYGRMMVDNLSGYGVDTSHLRPVTGSSGVAPIWVEPDGTNRILVVPGANRAITEDHVREAIDSGPAPAVVVGQLEIPQSATAAAFQTARRRGATTVLNPAPAAAIGATLLTATDWLIPNQVEFEQLAGVEPGDQSLHRLASSHDVRLVVTLGEAGAVLLRSDGTLIRIEAPEVEATDTTGAGDAFVAGFSYGLAAQWQEEEAVRLGVAVAADSVRREGAQSSFPSAEACRRIKAGVRG